MKLLIRLLGISSDGIAVYAAAYKVTRSIIRWDSSLMKLLIT